MSVAYFRISPVLSAGWPGGGVPEKRHPGAGKDEEEKVSVSLRLHPYSHCTSAFPMYGISNSKPAITFAPHSDT